MVATAAAGAPKVRQVGPKAKFKTPCKAFAAAGNGDVIEIDARGDYTGDVCSIGRDRLTIRGVNGRPKIDAAGKAAEGKAIWVVKGSGTVVDNIEFSGTAVPSNNGAGIRLEGKDLTVLNCYFHHNQNGILTTWDVGEVRVEHSEFGWNGHLNGLAHNIYAGATARFVLHASYMHHTVGGNAVKSRAVENLITYNRISQETGNGSYELDISEGGKALVMGNVIQQGVESVNEHMITFGMEKTRPESRMLLVHNTIVNIRPNARFFLHGPAAMIEARNNIFAGPGELNLRNAALPPGNVRDLEMRFADAGAHDYALAAGSPAIDAGEDAGEWEGKPVAPEWQYVRPGCIQARAANGRMDAGAIESGRNDAAAVCTAPLPPPAPGKKK
ncbi:MAG: hypothetical protein C0504_14230 [Candidatus Solibacter sp.]|nr:hypothetical protein [Candidatus Solibacter sp.]